MKHIDFVEAIQNCPISAQTDAEALKDVILQMELTLSFMEGQQWDHAQFALSELA